MNQAFTEEWHPVSILTSFVRVIISETRIALLQPAGQPALAY
jgi:hypothetical protein